MFGEEGTAGQMDALGRGWKWGACERCSAGQARVNRVWAQWSLQGWRSEGDREGGGLRFLLERKLVV